MEFNHNQSAEQSRMSRQLNDLERVFGEYSERIMGQIWHDNPSLSASDVVDHAWSLIAAATAYMGESTAENLAENAILIHEDYEAHRRIQDTDLESDR